MAARYWVGGSGNWSDAASHWAAASGAAPGVGNLPTGNDVVHFDAASALAPYTVTIDVVARFDSAVFAATAPTFAGGGVSLALAALSAAPDDGSVSITPEATPLQTWVVGDQVPLVATFLDGAGAPADPDDVSAEVFLPDGTTTNLDNAVIRTDVGLYVVLYAPTLNGLHTFRFAGTGTVVAAAEGAFMGQTEFPGVPA